MQNINSEILKTQIRPDVFYSARLGNIGKANDKGWTSGGRCPFHDDSKGKAFYVNTISGGYHCFSCGAKGGDIISFVMLADGMSFVDALKTLAKKYGIAGCSDESLSHTLEMKRSVARQARYEEALVHELLVLLQVLQARVADRLLVSDKSFRALRPEWRKSPDEHWERERMAAKRITKGLGVLYD